MVEVIWPLSVVPCRNESSTSGRGVLPLRTYIEETLRRSRTSYSTLQVALYYLILIKPFIPMRDFTMEQQMDCPMSRALMCGRRMFLAALILASKYLQDRNYSAKAWSKMSGLNVHEINANEMTFLSKVCWKLHIAEPLFVRWTEIVLRYTPSMHPPPPPGHGLALPCWKSIVPLLTAELDTVPMPAGKPTPIQPCQASLSYASETTPTPSKSFLSAPRAESTSNETTPTPANLLPRFLEPKPNVAPPMPALARMGPLPTPQLTPMSTASSTPAASTYGSRRPSICSAMSMAQQTGFNRCAIDGFPAGLPSMEKYCMPSRRPSVASTVSSGSSPESLISDRSRSSRASSISSVSTTASLAPSSNRPCLARQATCRMARLTLPPVSTNEGSLAKPITITDDTDMSSSPEPADFSVSEKVLLGPHRHSKHAPHIQPVAAPSQASCRKRARPCRAGIGSRPHGSRRSDLQEEVRLMMEEELDAMMDVDEDDNVALQSGAVNYASDMLSRDNNFAKARGGQTTASLYRQDGTRVPLQKNDGKKRTCCLASAMSFSPESRIGEVV